MAPLWEGVYVVRKTRDDERRLPVLPRHRARALIASAAIVLLIGLGASTRSTASPAEPSAETRYEARSAADVARSTAPLKATGLKRWGSSYATAGGYNRYSYVLVQRADARAAAKLPGTSLVYMSGTTIQKSWSAGVSYDEALANGWLLKADDGADVMNTVYRGYVGDIGNPAYQKRFADNLTAFLRATKVDGVFIDDVVANPEGLTGGVYPSKYPSPEAWEAAMVSFVDTVGRTLRARGWYVLVNALKFVPGDLRSNTAEPTAEFWSRLAPSVSGLNTEYWLQNPNDVSQLRSERSHWYENWESWQGLMSVAQRAGRDFFALSYGSAHDIRAMRYLRGSFLLGWNGRGGALIYSTTDSPDPYHPAWVRQLGSPLRPRFERTPGVWQRRYEKGTVVVNTTNAPVTVVVDGKRWTISSTDALMARRTAKTGA